MHKIAIMTDVHGNLPALEAVLQHIGDDYDLIVHLGDAIDLGPFPRECVTRLLALPRSLLIMGNHDGYFVNGIPDEAWLRDAPHKRQHLEWTHQQLDEVVRQQMAGWHYQQHMNIEGISVAFCHYALDSTGKKWRDIVPSASPEQADALFAQQRERTQHADTALLFHGHYHPFTDIQGKTRYLNAGSLGCFHKPLARYWWLECHEGTYKLEHREILYPQQDVFTAFEARKMPQRQEIYQNFFTPNGQYPS